MIYVFFFRYVLVDGVTSKFHRVSRCHCGFKVSFPNKFKSIPAVAWDTKQRDLSFPSKVNWGKNNWVTKLKIFDSQC